MSPFDLHRFQCGQPTKTKSGYTASFVAIQPENIPARLVVTIGGIMTNYYMDGSYLGKENPSDDDLVMAGLFD